MPRTTYDPNPHISVLDDAATKKQIAAQVDRVLDLNSRLRGLPISDDELAAVRFQIASNAMAEANPLYAAARSAANFLVVPLEDS
ncbi:MAG: hypothetical protein ACJ782_13700, partial [Actinomycetota bacterium]